jgi:TctA family transporter
MAAIASFAAGCVGTLFIGLFGPPLAEYALSFHAAEYFSLMLMALVAAAVLAQGDIVKALAMVVFGLLLGSVGTDVNSGMARFTFGVYELSDGIGFSIVAIALFAVAEIVKSWSTPDRESIRSQSAGLMPARG